MHLMKGITELLLQAGLTVWQHYWYYLSTLDSLVSIFSQSFALLCYFQLFSIGKVIQVSNMINNTKT